MIDDDNTIHPRKPSAAGSAPPDGPAAGSCFPSTCWSRVIGVPTDGDVRDPDLEALLTAYRRPIRAYLRARHRLEPATADDVTHDFLVTILEGAVIGRADRRRGRFRAFIKKSLDHWVIDRARAAQTAKRGGDRRKLSLDYSTETDEAITLPDPDARTPEEILDDAWRRELVTRALDEIRQELERDGKQSYYDVFAETFLSGDERPSHHALAERHGLRLTDVSNYLQNVKRRYRARLRQRILETVGDDDEFRAELAWMFGPTRGGTDRE